MVVNTGPSDTDSRCARRQKGASEKKQQRLRLLEEQRKGLPIASAREHLVELVGSSDTLIVVGEAGSGKTTQLPQYLLSAGFCEHGLVGITQPRRVAATTVAARVAEEMGVELGEEVGYSIRFEDRTGPGTRLKYMTDGMLLREALVDPVLSRYSVLVLDEAHERTVHTDVLLGLLKGIQARRRAAVQPEGASGSAGVPTKKRRRQASAPAPSLPPLKLVLMSATLETEQFCAFFPGARAVYIRGRQFPVEVLYAAEAEPDYLDAAMVAVLQVHLEEGPGDILVFLTGQEEIEALERLLRERAARLPPSRALAVATLYAALPSEQQMRAFKPVGAGVRKVILATNIAETSVTIPGVRFVVDPGLVKTRVFNPRSGVELLAVLPIAQAQAWQRSGRAGREGPGKCLRLYTEATFGSLAAQPTPEIARCNLANVVLQLKALGIHDVLGFDFVEKPPRAGVVRALETLHALGALDDAGRLVRPRGEQMAALPLEPLYAHALLAAAGMGVLVDMLALVAMLSAEGVFYTPKARQAEAEAAHRRLRSPDGDHVTLVRVFRAYEEETRGKAAGAAAEWCQDNFINARAIRRAVDVYGQVTSQCESMGLPRDSCGEDTLPFRRALAAAFFINAAQRQLDGTYRAPASGQIVSIHPSSGLFRANPPPTCVVFNELVRTSRQYIRCVTRIDAAWLLELAPRFYRGRGAVASGAEP